MLLHRLLSASIVVTRKLQYSPHPTTIEVSGFKYQVANARPWFRVFLNRIRGVNNCKVYGLVDSTSPGFDKFRDTYVIIPGQSTAEQAGVLFDQWFQASEHAKKQAAKKSP